MIKDIVHLHKYSNIFCRSSDFDYNFPNKSSSDGSYKVPKKIHFVWIGKPIGENYIKNIETFVMNKDYEVD